MTIEEEIKLLKEKKSKLEHDKKQKQLKKKANKNKQILYGTIFPISS